MATAVLNPSDLPYIKPYGEKAFNFGFRNPALDRRITLLEGSVRSSKTWALIPKILQLCRYQIKGWHLLTGVTKSTIYQNVLDDLFEIVGRSNYTYNRQSGELDLAGCKWLVIGAKDEGSEKYVRGLTVGAAVGDELTLQPRSFVMMLLNRMSVEGARFYATMNPDTPYHYVMTELIENEGLKAKGDIEVIHFALEDNPNLPPGYIDYLNTVYKPGSLYHQRFVLGLWVTGEGAIYKDVWGEHLLYDDKPWTMTNGRPGLVAPKGLRDPGSIAERTVAIDCGVDHVQTYGDWIDDGKVCWMDREYWWDSHETMRQKTEDEYTKDLKEFLKKAPGALTVIPPEQAGFDTALTQAGVWHTDADNEVLDGIKNVSIMMATGRLRFHRTRTINTQKQLQTYLWDPKAALRGIEQPLKQKDDGPDQVRYFVKTRIPDWRLSMPL